MLQVEPHREQEVNTHLKIVDECELKPVFLEFPLVEVDLPEVLERLEHTSRVESTHRVRRVLPSLQEKVITAELYYLFSRAHPDLPSLIFSFHPKRQSLCSVSDTVSFPTGRDFTPPPLSRPVPS